MHFKYLSNKYFSRGYHCSLVTRPKRHSCYSSTLQQRVQVLSNNVRTAEPGDCAVGDRLVQDETSQEPRRSARIRALQMQQGLIAGEAEKQFRDHGKITDLYYI